ncbi:organic cation transporter protein [Trichonephila clavipes]|nr:organic cation transporter protein [Trichonephila clavipes]
MSEILLDLKGVLFILFSGFYHGPLISLNYNMATVQNLELLPESPRWLLSQGKEDSAREILSKAAKKNGVNLTEIETKLKETILKTSKARENGDGNTSVLQLFKPGLWKTSSIVFYLWFVNAFMYYGISYNTNELAGDPIKNFALYGAVEIPAYIFTYFATHSKGRRNPLALVLAGAGLSYLLLYPVPRVGCSDLTVRRCCDQWTEMTPFTLRPSSRCFRQTSHREDHRIIRHALAKSTASLDAVLTTVTPSLRAPVSSRSIARCLAKGHLVSWCPLRVLPMTPTQQHHCLYSDDNRVRVWRPRDECLNPAFALQRHTTPEAGVMVWGVIAFDIRSPLILVHDTITAQRDVHDTLQSDVLPHLVGLRGAFFQQDNARPHTGRMQ